MAVSIYSDLAKHYSPQELAGTAFRQGTYYRIAGDILEGKKWFQKFPEVIASLRPSAACYHQIFNETVQQLQNDAEFVPSIDLLRAHILFTNAFVTAYKLHST